MSMGDYRRQGPFNNRFFADDYFGNIFDYFLRGSRAGMGLLHLILRSIIPDWSTSGWITIGTS